MFVISIDGACRRNGKPDCLSAGGLFIQEFGESLDEPVQTGTMAEYELQSTNQRGEMHALKAALEFLWPRKQQAQIITDSEYLFNAMTKGWVTSWARKGWVTATGEPVKNKDLWEAIHRERKRCVDNNVEVMFYHIKGHCIPFGKVTANSLLSKDSTGQALFNEVKAKYATSQDKDSVKKNIEKAKGLSIKNNGFELDEETLSRFVCANVMADAIATKCVDTADALYLSRIASNRQ